MIGGILLLIIHSLLTNIHSNQFLGLDHENKILNFVSKTHNFDIFKGIIVNS
jgi:hypothetical protein